MIITKEISVSANGCTDILNISEQIKSEIHKSGMIEGSVTVFVVDSTAAVTTIEYEPGLKKYLNELLEGLIPKSKKYQHTTCSDDNGHSHLRALLYGPSFTIPF
jgi:secondary thiamine-phosphate synthase enzyme